ncbi:MAG: IclR family transcriptional regulator [Microbacteriaceae bacterium]
MNGRSLDTSVGKAAMLLTAFNSLGGGGTLTELADHAGVPKPTAHRLLGLLQHSGLIERVGTTYTLTSMVFQLGAMARGGEFDSLRRAALPHMAALQGSNAARVSLSVLDGVEALILDQWDFHRGVRDHAGSHRRLPVHATACGKALVAFRGEDVLDEVLRQPLEPFTRTTITRADHLARELGHVRDTGLALDRQEGREGLICLALPVHDSRRSVVAAVSVSGSTRTFDPRRAEPLLRSCVTAIGRDLHAMTLLAS